MNSGACTSTTPTASAASSRADPDDGRAITAYVIIGKEASSHYSLGFLSIHFVAEWIHFTLFGIILPTIKLKVYTFWGL